MYIDQTTADTLNKALDLAKQGVVAGFETVKTYAPYVWQLARRQVILEGVKCAILTGLCIGVLCAMIPVWRWGIRRIEDGPFVLLPGLATVVAATIAFTAGDAAINYIFNPDFWTMMKILELIKH